MAGNGYPVTARKGRRNNGRHSVRSRSLSGDAEWLNLSDDQCMSIDPVAVYAAVVATGALGWQVYQWRSDRQGKLDERKSELDVKLGAEWHSDDDRLMYVNFVNSNDYPVRLTELRIGTEPTETFLRTAPLGAYGSVAFYTSPERLGLPTSLVPAHDSLTHRWHAAELDEMLGDMEFRPGYAATVRAG
jgi:hypothetical protein